MSIDYSKIKYNLKWRKEDGWRGWHGTGHISNLYLCYQHSVLKKLCIDILFTKDYTIRGKTKPFAFSDWIDLNGYQAFNKTDLRNKIIQLIESGELLNKKQKELKSNAIDEFYNNQIVKTIRILELQAINIIKKLQAKGNENLSGIDSMAFNKDILKYKAGLLSKNHRLSFTPQLFLKNYVENEPIMLKQSVIDKALIKHNLLIDDFINLPEKINNPLAIFNSMKHDTSKLFLVELKNVKNLRVVVVIATSKGNEINDISSVHGKFRRQLIRWEQKGLCIYKKENFDF